MRACLLIDWCPLIPIVSQTHDQNLGHCSSADTVHLASQATTRHRSIANSVFNQTFNEAISGIVLGSRQRNDATPVLHHNVLLNVARHPGVTGLARNHLSSIQRLGLDLSIPVLDPEISQHTSLPEAMTHATRMKGSWGP